MKKPTQRPSPRNRAIDYAIKMYPVRSSSAMQITIDGISRRVAEKHFLAGYRAAQRDAKKETT